VAPGHRGRQEGDAVDPRPNDPAPYASTTHVRDSDEARLHQMGYAQELRRNMSGFSNFAVSFTIISILSGCLTLYGFGLNTGGPRVIVWAGRSSAS
jgi:hypothetical protein